MSVSLSISERLYKQWIRSNHCMQDKMIRISLKNWEKLRMLGHTPESFNDIISKMLKENVYGGGAVVADEGAKATE